MAAPWDYAGPLLLCIPTLGRMQHVLARPRLRAAGRGTAGCLPGRQCSPEHRPAHAKNPWLGYATLRKRTTQHVCTLLPQVFMEGRLETRVPLTSRTGTKDAGEIWVSLRSEEGAGASGVGAGVAGMEVKHCGDSSFTTKSMPHGAGWAGCVRNLPGLGPASGLSGEV
jgi:hypothetical protein